LLLLGGAYESPPTLKMVFLVFINSFRQDFFNYIINKDNNLKYVHYNSFNIYSLKT